MAKLIHAYTAMGDYPPFINVSHVEGFNAVRVIVRAEDGNMVQMDLPLSEAQKIFKGV